MTNTLDLSVIIPFKDHSDLTISCFKSITSLSIKEIILVSNNSTERELKLVQDASSNYKNVKVLVHNVRFNYQEINNWAIKQSTGKVIWLLNNDVEIPSKYASLVADMYHEALKTEVGSVGVVLTYADQRTIQHAGVYLVPGGTADHLYIGKSLEIVKRGILNNKYIYDITKNLNTSAVTAASLMVERSKYNEVNGFDERFIITGGDVDLCLRLLDKGYQSVLLGSNHGTMIHKESQSRSHIGIPYSDFYYSYLTYIKHFDLMTGDKYIHWKEIQR